MTPIEGTNSELAMLSFNVVKAEKTHIKNKIILSTIHFSTSNI